jgi:pyruvate,water dikinase
MSAVLMYEDSLRQLLRRVGVSYDDFALPILASGEKSVSTQQAFDLLELAALARQSEVASAYFHHATGLGDYREKLSGTEFLCQFDAYLARYGHRGRHESDWSIPRFAEDPSPLLEAIRFHVLAPACPSARTIVEEQDARAAEAWKLFESRLAARDRVITAPLVRWLLRRIKRMYLWRELYRSELVQQLSEARRWHLQVADRFLGHGWVAQRDDYFMLTFAEVCAALRGTLDANRIRELVQQRQREFDEWREIEMPMQLRESDLPRLLRSRRTQGTADREWRGLCVSPGFAEGEVVVLRAPDDFSRMKPGAIIVAPATDPAWTPLFTLASGLIVEIGGLLSHASTVAREYSLPALANVFNATSILHDGDRVRLDASGGVVELLTPAATPDPARTAFSPV